MDRASPLIDRIYTAAVEASAWPDAFDHLQARFRGIAAGLYVADLQDNQILPVEQRGVDAGCLQVYIERFLGAGPWSRVPELQRAGCIRTDRSLDEYHGSPGFYHRTALYSEWMKPQDFIYTLGTNLLVDQSRQIKCFVYRPRAAGAFVPREIAWFRALAGHLANAVRIARRLALQEAHFGAVLGVADRMAFGVVLLDEAGRIIEINGRAEGLLHRREGLWVREGRVVAAHHADNGRLADAVQAALALHHGCLAAAPRPIALRRGAGRRPLCLIAEPLPRGCDNPFLSGGRAAVALIVTDPDDSPAIAGDWLRQRYGLTATEARLAQCLARGLALREAAEHTGLTYETARWYLKVIFQKTGATRQAELIRQLLCERPVLGHG